MQPELLIVNGVSSDQPNHEVGCAQQQSIITWYKRPGLERSRRCEPFTGPGGSCCMVFSPSVTGYDFLGCPLHPADWWRLKPVYRWVWLIGRYDLTVDSYSPRLPAGWTWRTVVEKSPHGGQNVEQCVLAVDYVRHEKWPEVRTYANSCVR